jgi:hypothetical protein
MWQTQLPQQVLGLRLVIDTVKGVLLIVGLASLKAFQVVRGPVVFRRPTRIHALRFSFMRTAQSLCYGGGPLSNALAGSPPSLGDRRSTRLLTDLIPGFRLVILRIESSRMLPVLVRVLRDPCLVRERRKLLLRIGHLEGSQAAEKYPTNGSTSSWGKKKDAGDRGVLFFKRKAGLSPSDPRR